MLNQERLLSLDAFRGFTIAAMILVNYPGSWSHVYTPLLHAEWNGLTPTDLVFPFFLFIVGVSISLAYSKRLKRGDSKGKMLQKIMYRSVRIFMAGLFLNFIHHFDFAELRIAGVLQRIAVVFLVCASLYLYANKQVQVVLFFILLVGYWIAMVSIPTPGYGKAMLDPGINLAAWIDSEFLPGKRWNETWDPEGLLSTIPAICTSLLGVFTGHLLQSHKTWKFKITWMVLSGFVLLFVGFLVSLSFPVNKNLWSSSYVLVTGGMALMLLSVFLFLIDLRGHQKFAFPFIVFGMNAIAAYFLADLLSFVFYGISIGGNSLNVHFVLLANSTFFQPELLSLLYAILFVIVNFIPVCFLYKKKIFLKL